MTIIYHHRQSSSSSSLKNDSDDNPPFNNLKLSFISQKKLNSFSPKPLPSSKIGNMRIHHKTTFQNRKSLLDIDNFGGSITKVTGIISLFWVSLSLYMLKLFFISKMDLSKLFQLELLFNSYGDYLFFSVIIITISLYSLFIPYGYQLLQMNKIFFPSSSYCRTFIARHAIQMVPSCTIIAIGNFRRWPVVQMAVSLMYSIVLLMKIHSFLATCEALDLEGRSLVYLPSLKDYALYFCYPTLVFELEYPRTDKRRWSYIIDRTFGLLGIGIIFYSITEGIILPLIANLKENSVNIFIVYFELMIPCLVLGILSFFMIFEYVLNWAAEVTRFGDRHFYEDWWNSKDMADWARKWNLPVHRFLEKHVYKASINRWALSKRKAQILTFIYSSILHEFVIGFALKKMIFCLFFMQMSQIPLMSLTRHLRMDRYPFLANCIWWTLMITGVPLIVLIYSI